MPIMLIKKGIRKQVKTNHPGREGGLKIAGMMAHQMLMKTS